MAVPILYLDADDEITSAAARIRSTDAERVALVLPYGSRLATSRINFRLLAREATERGKTIEIVAADASARALAASAGLPVHASVAAFESAGLPGAGVPGVQAGNAAFVAAARPTRPGIAEDDTPTSVILVPRLGREPVPIVGRPRPPIRTGVAVGIILAVVAVVGIVAVGAFTFLPSATIVLAPRSQSLGPLSDTVEARPDINAPDQATLEIPSHRYPFEVDVSQTFQTTGKKVTEAAARGSVTFTNCDPTARGAVSIPAGSRVTTSGGIGFRTQASLTIKRASINGQTINCRTGSVSVVAEKPGTDGNVAAGQITKIPPGYDAIVLTVTNQNPTSGGLHDETPQVSQADIAAALVTLNTALGDAFDAKIQGASGLPAGTTLFSETKVLGTTTSTVDPATLVGQAVPEFQLGLSASGSVIGVDSSPVDDLAASRLSSHVAAGFSLDPTSIVIDIGTPTVVGEIVSFPVSMRATEVRVVDAAALLAQVKGLDLPAARAKLDAYGDVSMSVWPDWVTTVPTNPDRVTLTLGSPQPAPSPTP